MSGELFEQLVKGEISEAMYKRELEKHKYVVGARVKHKSCGKGTIKVFHGTGDDGSIGVEFDKNMGGHTLEHKGSSRAKAGHGWWTSWRELDLIDEEKETPKQRRVAEIIIIDEVQHRQS